MSLPKAKEQRHRARKLPDQIKSTAGTPMRENSDSTEKQGPASKLKSDVDITRRQPSKFFENLKSEKPLSERERRKTAAEARYQSEDEYNDQFFSLNAPKGAVMLMAVDNYPNIIPRPYRPDYGIKTDREEPRKTRRTRKRKTEAPADVD